MYIRLLTACTYLILIIKIKLFLFLISNLAASQLSIDPLKTM